YDKAVWMRPDIRQTLVQQQRTDAQKQAAEQKRRARAKTASGGVRGAANPKATTLNPDASLRDTLNAALDGDLQFKNEVIIMAIANTQVSDLIATTIAARSRKLADNLAHNNALLYQLRKRGNVRTVSGGTHIMEEIMYDDGGDGSAGSYSGYDVIDITPDSPISAAEFD